LLQVQELNDETIWKGKCIKTCRRPLSVFSNIHTTG
jgi:hypothetical protein